MDEAKRFQLLGNIMRAAHFEWRRTALALSPNLDPMTLVKRYWEEVGKDTAKFYLSKIDPSRDLAEQMAKLFVSSSVIMGEDAATLPPDEQGRCGAKHNDCPWFHWHKKEGLLKEDQPGCDRFIQVVVDEINKTLKSRLRFETKESLPEGGKGCVRKFWVEK